MRTATAVLATRTAEERYIVYETLIRKIDKGELFYLCDAIGDLCGVNRWDSLKALPELDQQKPKDPMDRVKSYPWYSMGKKGMQKRKECLEKAAKLCLEACQ